MNETGTDIREPRVPRANRSVLPPGALALALLLLVPTTTSAQQPPRPSPATTLDLLLRGEPGTSIHWDGVYLGDLDTAGQLRIGGVPRGLTVPLEAGRDGFRERVIKLRFTNEPSPTEVTIAALDPVSPPSETAPVAPLPVAFGDSIQPEPTPDAEPSPVQATEPLEATAPAATESEAMSVTPTEAVQPVLEGADLSNAPVAEDPRQPGASLDRQPAQVVSSSAANEPDDSSPFAVVLVSSGLLLVAIATIFLARAARHRPANDTLKAEVMTPNSDDVFRPASPVTRVHRETHETARLREQLGQREDQLHSNYTRSVEPPRGEGEPV